MRITYNDIYHCRPYQLLEIWIRLIIEPIGSYQIQHLKILCQITVLTLHHTGANLVNHVLLAVAQSRRLSGALLLQTHFELDREVKGRQGHRGQRSLRSAMSRVINKPSSLLCWNLMPILPWPSQL